MNNDRGSCIATLMRGLLDQERRLVTRYGSPTTRCSGARVFEDRRDLRLLEATPFDNGVVLLRYEVMN